jgi:membrane-bound lytic murein transglycosylase A
MTSGRGIVSIGRTGGAALLALARAGGAPAAARNPLKLPGTQYEPVNWAQVDGWAADDHDQAFTTFLKSCNAILQGPPKRDGHPMAGALFKVCKKAAELKPQKPGEARRFFEQSFRPVRIAPLGAPQGFLTGYYEPIVDGQRERAGGYDYPLYRKPPNLLPGGRMAILGAVASHDGKGKKRKHVRRRLVPFYDRARIDDGALAGRDLEICWLKDPIDSFFAQIQGSVRVQLDDGRLMRLNYAAANGHPYYAVGRDLIERNIIPKDEMSMDRIREWMLRHPEEGRELRRKNKSYVFFRETRLSSNEEPIGAEGVPLTPGRSIAVDRKLHTYGTPFFISAYLPIEGLTPDTWFRRLMIAQDTGGAIVGPARADIYFGAGDEAETIAGRLRHDGTFVMLVPNELLPSAVDEEIPLPRPNLLDVPVAATPAQPAPESTASTTLEKPADKAEADADKAESKAKVAATAVEPVLPKPKPAANVEPKVEHKAAAKPRRKKKHHRAADTGDDGSLKAWESRVMPVIKPDAPGKAPKHKKKG